MLQFNLTDDRGATLKYYPLIFKIPSLTYYHKDYENI